MVALCRRVVATIACVVWGFCRDKSAHALPKKQPSPTVLLTRPSIAGLDFLREPGPGRGRHVYGPSRPRPHGAGR